MKTRLPKSARLRRAVLPSPRRACFIEPLEARIAPALTLTISNANSGAIVISRVGGLATISPFGSGANLNWQDVENEFLAGNNVLITTGTSGTEAGDIIDTGIFSFTSIPAGKTLTIQSGTGTGLVGNITLGNHSFAGSNESIVVTANGNLTTGGLFGAVGSTLASISLTATTGALAVTGALAATDLALSANTGIGTSASPVPTATANLVAKNATSGGIFISNTGDLNIGFSGDPFQGVLDSGAAADPIILKNLGRINVTRNAVANEIISAPGKVTVTATGASADIVTGENLNNLANGNNALKGSIVSVNSDVSLTAGRDLLLGNSAMPSLFGNALAGGNLVLNASRNIVLDSFSVASASAFSVNPAATLTASAGGNISLLQSNGSVGSEFATQGGDITLVTAAGGSFTANSGTGTGDVQSHGGAIIIQADSITLTDARSLTTNSPVNGSVTLEQVSTGRPIDLGTKTVGALGLTDAELHRIGAGVLRIGNVHTGAATPFSGGINVSAPITTATGFTTLSLLADAGSIMEALAGSLAVASLAAQADAGVSLGQLNQVGTLAGHTANNPFTFANGGGTLTVGTVDGVAGIDAGAAGDVALTVGTAAATGILVSANPNDKNADVHGRTVSLTALGPSNGNTGQIGFFTTSAQFFEVTAQTLNASTNNSRAWISAIGGASIGSVNVGTNTAFLQTINGDLTSTHTGTTPDITAATVVLSGSGANGASLGALGQPLLIQASTLRATDTATGLINVSNVPAGGSLTTLASTANGRIIIDAAGGDLVMLLSATSINAPGNTVSLVASGAIRGAQPPPGSFDVVATELILSAGSGIGAAAALHTQVTQLEALTGSGGIFVLNTGALQIGHPTDLNPAISVADSGAISLSASGPLTVVSNITGPDDITLTVAETGATATDNVVVAAGATVSSTGGDVALRAGDDVVVHGSVSALAGNVDLRSGSNDSDMEGTITIGGAVTVGAGAAHNIALDVSSTNTALDPSANSVTEDAFGSLVGGSLLLLNLVQDGGHAIALDGSAANSIGTIAGSTTAAVRFLNEGPLTEDLAGSPVASFVAVGLFSQRDVFLGTLSGDLTLTNTISSGGAVELSSGGAIIESVAGTIVGSELGAQAAGNIDLANASLLNHVATIALGTTGPGSHIHFSNDSSFTVDSVPTSGAFGGVTGIHTHDGDIDLIAVGASSSITIQQPISTIPASDDEGAAAVRLQAGAGIAESGFTGLISTDDLAVLAAGPVTLLTFSNIIRGHVSIVDTVAAAFIELTTLSGFTVGAVPGDSLFGDTAGIKTNNGEISLLAGAGIITIEQSINANAVGGGGVAEISLQGVDGVAIDAAILAPGSVGIVTPGTGSVGLHTDIRIHANGMITSGSTIDLKSADGIIIDAGASLTAQGALTMEVGNRSADSGVGGLWSSLGTMNGASISISGGPNNDVFIAPADGKAEPFEGGGGVNTYVAPIVPGDITVTDSGIINAAIGNDTFSHIQVVNLSGDSGANHIDATGFSGFSVVSGGGGADIINGASVLIRPLGLSFTSTDGDAVSVKLTKGSLDATNVLLTPNAGLTGADLQLLDFHGNQAFNGTKIKITAKHTATGGDGFFDLGNIDATGINLGAVTIPGDLGTSAPGRGARPALRSPRSPSIPSACAPPSLKARTAHWKAISSARSARSRSAAMWIRRAFASPAARARLSARSPASPSAATSSAAIRHSAAPSPPPERSGASRSKVRCSAGSASTPARFSPPTALRSAVSPPVPSRAASPTSTASSPMASSAP